MRPAAKRIGYALYIFGITVVFLYTLFPAEALKDYLAHQLSGGNPDVNVVIDRVRPVLPLGLKFSPVRYEQGGQTLFVMNQMSVRPQLFSMLKRATVYAFEGRAYGGRIDGDAGPFDADSGGPGAMQARLSDIRIDQIPAVTAMVPKKITGRLSGRLSLDARSGLTAKLTLREGDVQVQVPLLGLESLGFQSFDADIVLAGQTLTVKQGTLKSAELDAAVSGTIRIGARPEQATLNLRGTVSPHHAFLAQLERLPTNLLRGRNSIGFRLNGPVGSPGIAFE